MRVEGGESMEKGGWREDGGGKHGEESREEEVSRWKKEGG